MILPVLLVVAAGWISGRACSLAASIKGRLLWPGNSGARIDSGSVRCALNSICGRLAGTGQNATPPKTRVGGGNLKVSAAPRLAYESNARQRTAAWETM